MVFVLCWRTMVVWVLLIKHEDELQKKKKRNRESWGIKNMRSPSQPDSSKVRQIHLRDKTPNSPGVAMSPC